MEFYLNSESASQIRKLEQVMPIDGVVLSHPVSASKISTRMNSLLSALRTEQKLFVPITSISTEQMIKEALHVYSLGPNSIPMIPVTPQGLQAVRICSQKGMQVMACNIGTCEQAFMAIRNGAAYAMLRHDSDSSAFAKMLDLVRMLRVNHMSASVMVSAVDNRAEFHELSMSGIQAVSVTPSAAAQLLVSAASQVTLAQLGAHC
ncbi:MAG: hypothetical protein LKF50_05055 [Solobacterium sp.]|jgi:transaldolase|nr:hypothetical protein [Solobacterium sp.]